MLKLCDQCSKRETEFCQVQATFPTEKQLAEAAPGSIRQPMLPAFIACARIVFALRRLIISSWYQYR
jgi:hypothetical protein